MQTKLEIAKIISFEKHAWDDYLYWQKTNKPILKKINELIKDIQRTPFNGIGKPEPLKGNLSGYYSRKVDSEHRLVYKVIDTNIIIGQCRFHYD